MREHLPIQSNHATRWSHKATIYHHVIGLDWKVFTHASSGNNLCSEYPALMCYQGGIIQLVRYSMTLSTWWYRRRKFSIAVSTLGTNCIILCDFAQFLPRTTNILENYNIRRENFVTENHATRRFFFAILYMPTNFFLNIKNINYVFNIYI